MDAGAREDLPSYVAPTTRLPSWLFKRNQVIPKDQHGNIALRPDILLIPGLPLSATQSPRFMPSDRSKHTVYIIEVGYCADTNHAAKTHEKAEQHQLLHNLLTQAGWGKVVYTTQESISLGAAGTVSSQLAPLLSKLGVPFTTARKTMD
ncbi:hypothetical protein TSOC_007790 [Tetrabaena socialis]|uniref:Uncharacterized protein n=1 Tax=Tetrabaena socialis TaxID=47790 RepID=A0A2J8A050_9CHLO|nr:hypothetical protein TSOC_007790 [Tetrabaena socialis]|eukprot:PNH05907.1 hypothetical protein TSOC_007790 [Tetrabaena socialis]